MEVNMPIHHHQHEIVDFFIVYRTTEHCFGIRDHARLFGKCGKWKVAIGRRVAFCGDDQRPGWTACNGDE